MKFPLIALVIAALCVFSLPRLEADEGADQASEPGESGAMKEMGAHMHMGPHMTMTPSRPATSEDTKRADELLKTMRDSLSKYQDYKAAIADGYQPFMPRIPQELYHFANRGITGAEYLGDFDPKHPGSLLYRKKTFGGYELVGAMYSAGEDATPDQLDRLIPLSIAHWHAHTNICLPKGVSVMDVVNGNVKADAHFAGAMDPSHDPMNMSHGRNSSARLRYGYMADGRFGIEGRIADASGCESAGGEFHKQIFGWMVHVYPFAGDNMKVAFGTDAP